MINHFKMLSMEMKIKSIAICNIIKDHLCINNHTNRHIIQCKKDKQTNLLCCCIKPDEFICCILGCIVENVYEILVIKKMRIV